ncbi:MAG: TonB family protein [Flavobacteriales bacterium]|nr:TonB family protein [Flavobacteriales bacterium]
MNALDFLFVQGIFAFLTLVFALLFSQVKSFKLNRWLLLFIPLLSCAWIWIDFGPQVSQQISRVYLPEFVIVNASPNTTDSTGIEWFYLYFAISFLLLIYTAFRLQSQLKNGKRISTVEGIITYEIDGENSYSFGGRMFLTQTDKNNPLIIAHELTHLKQKHWLDMVWSQLLVALCWCNPMVWYWRRLIQQNHEYLADEATVESNQFNKKAYLLLLLDKTFETQHFSMEHYFSLNSLISNRIVMLNKTKKGQWGRLILGGVLLFGSALYMGGCAKTNTEPKTIGVAVEDAVPSETLKEDDSEVLTKAEIMPDFPGGMSELYAFLGSNLKYPEACKKDGIEGIVYVSFVITESGKVTGARVLKGVHELMDAETIRVVSMMPDWIPAEDKGKKVKVQYNMPIRFKMKTPLPPPSPTED